jgi:CRP-like cAMP-binding protein
MNLSSTRGVEKELMSIGLTQTAGFKNQILTGLPRNKYANLFANFRPVNLSAREVLYDAEDEMRSAYFINSGMASFMAISSEGNIIEVGNAGNEGMVGIPLLLRNVKTPHQVVVQVPGEALMISADILQQEFEKEGELKNRLLRYTHAVTTYMSLLGVCNHFHTVDKRLCRWLLISSLQVQSKSFQLTHESLSQILGTGRTGVTMAANKLQKSGLIKYYRGQITILDHAAMEDCCCDCYQATKEIFEQFFLGS